MSSYGTIFKTTVLFSSLRVLTILVKLALNKIISISLGVSGIGLYGILTSTMSLLVSFFDFGISKSSIRSISESRGNKNEKEISLTIIIVKKLILCVSLLGGLLTILLSDYISLWSFGDTDYSFYYKLIGLAVFFTIINAGREAVFQGMRKFKFITLNTSLTSFISLIISVPLIYLFKINGIVYAILSSAIIGFIISSIYIKKIEYTNINHTDLLSKKTFNIIQLGLSMMVVSLLVTLSGYIIRAYIQKSGGLDDVGFFQAGFQIISGYFGIILSSMVVDYFPRISAINNDNIQVEKEVNQQGILTLLLILPLVVILQFLAPYIIPFLYSYEFLTTIEYVNIAIFGIIFQSGSQTMGMVLLAKNESKLFVISVTVFQSVFLIFNILGYKYYGILGLGFTFTLNMIIHFIMVQIYNRFLYKISYNVLYYKFLIVTLAFSIIAFLFKDFAPLIKWSSFFVLTITSIYFSVSNLMKLMKINSIIELIKSKINGQN